MKMNPKHKKAAKTALLALGLIAVTAASAFAAEEAAEAPTTMEWVWRVVDFSVIAGLLVYFLTGPMKTFFKKRVEDIETSLAEAKAAREEALKRLADVQARLKDKDAEIQALVKVAEENGRKEKELLLKDSEQMGVDILASAKENIDAELLKAKDALRREAALLAVELAEKLVKENIKKEDQARIVEEYIAKVGG